MRRSLVTLRTPLRWIKIPVIEIQDLSTKFENNVGSNDGATTTSFRTTGSMEANRHDQHDGSESYRTFTARTSILAVPPNANIGNCRASRRFESRTTAVCLISFDYSATHQRLQTESRAPTPAPPRSNHITSSRTPSPTDDIHGDHSSFRRGAVFISYLVNFKPLPTLPFYKCREDAISSSWRVVVYIPHSYVQVNYALTRLFARLMTNHGFPFLLALCHKFL